MKYQINKPNHQERAYYTQQVLHYFLLAIYISIGWCNEAYDKAVKRLRNLYMTTCIWP